MLGSMAMYAEHNKVPSKESFMTDVTGDWDNISASNRDHGLNRKQKESPDSRKILKPIKSLRRCYYERMVVWQCQASIIKIALRFKNLARRWENGRV